MAFDGVDHHPFEVLPPEGSGPVRQRLKNEECAAVVAIPAQRQTILPTGQ
jgi:hypothetical protein